MLIMLELSRHKLHYFMNNNFLAVSTASRYSNYHSDYLTQMCRKGLLTCRQISKVWFISLGSLENYLKRQKKQAKLSKYEIERELVQLNENLSGESSFFIADKNYVDSDTASKISSYNRDYLTQLARSGDIKAKKIGKVWFFEEESLRKHMQRQKRSDLIAEQAVSVAIRSTETLAEKKKALFSYEAEKQEELLPNLTEREQKVPIRVARSDSELQIHNDSINERVREEMQRSIALKSDAFGADAKERPDKNSILSSLGGETGRASSKSPTSVSSKKGLLTEQSSINTSLDNSSSRDNLINRKKANIKQAKRQQYGHKIKKHVVYRQLEIDLTEEKVHKNSASVIVVKKTQERESFLDTADSKFPARRKHSIDALFVADLFLSNLTLIFIFLSLLILLYINLLSFGIFDLPYRSYSAF